MSDNSFHEAIKASGDIHYQCIDRNGVVIDDVKIKNLIVTVGKTAMARLLGGSGTGRNVTHFGIGTNGTGATLGDTALTSPYVVTVSVTYPSANQVQFSYLIDYAEANGFAIQEFGLLCDNGNLFSRREIPTLTKTAMFQIVGTWTINF